MLRAAFLGLLLVLLLAPAMAQVCIDKAPRPKTAAEKKKEKAAIAQMKKLPGYAIFESSCAPCHGIYDANTGPALVQGAQMYSGNKAGLISWLKSPTRKRKGGAQMPPQSHLTAKELDAVAGWVLAIK